MNDETFTIEDLINKTDAHRELASIFPDANDSEIPKSVIRYRPIIWMEDDVYHTLLGSFPDEGIWALGTTPVESMQEFDRELQIRLNGDKLEPITKHKRQEIHKEVFKKIDTLLGW
jgi:hypothetical protein